MLRQNGAEWGRETGAATQFPVISYPMIRGMKAAKNPSAALPAARTCV